MEDTCKIMTMSGYSVSYPELFEAGIPVWIQNSDPQTLKLATAD